MMESDDGYPSPIEAYLEEIDFDPSDLKRLRPYELAKLMLHNFGKKKPGGLHIDEELALRSLCDIINHVPLSDAGRQEREEIILHAERLLGELIGLSSDEVHMAEVERIEYLLSEGRNVDEIRAMIASGAWRELE